MKRRGIYTQKLSPWRRFLRFIHGRWTWFKLLPWWKKALIILSPFAVVLAICIGIYIYYMNDISDPERLMNRNNTGVVLQDKNGEAFYKTGKESVKDMVPLDKISNEMKNALIASEDKNFYKHGGFSPMTVILAFGRNILSRDGTSYGGSTLTQQLAKNTLLTNDRTFVRKFKEMVISIAIEQRYSKDEILTMYLNSVYYGNNSFGIAEASHNYYHKEPAQLTLAESSALVGMLPAPTAYSPITGDEKLTDRQRQTVLRRMVENNMITERQKTEAMQTKITYYKAKDELNNIAPHFTQMVIRELYNKFGEENVKRSGYTVKTSLDLGQQKVLNQAVANRMPYIRRLGGSNASAVALDSKTGQIRALVGSSDWSNEDWGKVNMVTTKRQPGSTFKAIYYGKGLADGTITPATVLKDEEINVNGYSPKNATRRYYGDVTVRQALDWSLNIPAVKVLQKVGITTAVKQAQSQGISTLDAPSHYGLSLAIGSAEVPLLEMTNAYAVYADSGQYKETTTLTEINDKFHKQIYQHTTKRTPVLTSQGAYLLSNILSDQNARSGMFGSSLAIGNKKIAVKTGTTDDNRDAWTIGYTPDITVGVWVGNNDNRVMVSGGADMAAPIWKQAMTSYVGNTNPEFTRPNGIVEALVCKNGALAENPGSNTRTEVFISSAKPTERCNTQAEKEEQERKAAEEKQKQEDAKKEAEDKAKKEAEEKERRERGGNLNERIDDAARSLRNRVKNGGNNSGNNTGNNRRDTGNTGDTGGDTTGGNNTGRITPIPDPTPGETDTIGTH